jgi:ElaB/YqjD/DUF883 family membrane-anchored ribosome-binding protein
MGLTFEKVWAALMESRETVEREMRESREKTEREMRESREKAESEMQKLRESLRETDRVVKETSRIVGSLGNKFGELAEHLVAPNIAEKFNALGYSFTYVTNRTKFRDEENGKIMAEVDVLLNNRDFVMAVEVKAQPAEEHVREHIQRMEVLRRYADAHEDGRKYIGAIAGAIMNEQVKRYAVKSGFYVIEQSGDTVKVYAPEGFKPREW